LEVTRVRSSVRSVISHSLTAVIAVSGTLPFTQGPLALVPHLFLFGGELIGFACVITLFKIHDRHARAGDQLTAQILQILRQGQSAAGDQLLNEIAAVRQEHHESRTENLRLLRQTFTSVAAMARLQREGIATVIGGSGTIGADDDTIASPISRPALRSVQ
jgi:hypothetical protein